MAKRKSINYPGFKHENPIPNASLLGNILMSSIISGRDPDTATMPPELDAQVVNIFKQIKLCVEAAGGTLDDIVKTTVYLTEGTDREEFAQAYRHFFATHGRSRAMPTGLTVVVGELSPRCLVEIDSVAYLGSR